MSVRRLATRDFRMRFFFKKIELAVYAVFALRNAHVDREVSRGEPIANNHLYTNIVLFLADPQAQFTIDTEHLARCSSFFLRRTLRFRVVDTPSVASEPSDGSA